MAIKAALVDYLLANTSLIGDRLSQNVVPEGESLPAAAYQRVSHRQIYSHGGSSGLARARFQISVVAATPDAAEDAAEEIVTALDGQSGLGGDENLRVGASMIDNRRDDYAPTSKEHVEQVDVIFWHAT